MILADTSVWVAHFRTSHAALSQLLHDRRILTHPYVIGELACGNLSRQSEILESLQRLPSAPVASHPEVLYFIEQNRLMGLGIGYVDAHLLASAALEPPTQIWTHDKRLAAAAQGMRLAHTDQAP